MNRFAIKEVQSLLNQNFDWCEYGKQGECIGDDINNFLTKELESFDYEVLSCEVLDDVLEDILAECEYQNNKWGGQHIRQQTVEGHLLVLQSEVQEAIDGWMKNSTGRNSVESEITQVAAVAIQALINIKLAKLPKGSNFRV